MDQLIDVPAGLHGVAVADTTIGTVHGDEGFYHYRQYDATELARENSFEEAWFLLERGDLPGADARERFRAEVAALRTVPAELQTVIEAVAAVGGSPLSQLRSVLSCSAGPLGLRPVLDLDTDARAAQARRIAAVVPSVLAALHRAAAGLPTVERDPADGHAAAYLRAVTGTDPDPSHIRALEQYLVLTIDHGFNASTFTARVVASTGPTSPTSCAPRSVRSPDPCTAVPRAGRSTRSMRSDHQSRRQPSFGPRWLRAVG